MFTTIRTEGAILPADLLQRIAVGDTSLDGLSPQSYHLLKDEKLNEAINRSWNRLRGAWAAFNTALAGVHPDDPATTVTRERWLLHLFRELDYGRLMTTPAMQIGERSYPISHLWHNTPIHLVGARIDLDRRTARVAGAARSSPHSMVQDLLNRSDDYLWGFVSNGITLRILRDSVSITRQAYVEFDLQAMMDGEGYADFVLLWMLCHQSRVEAAQPEDCWLERWSRTAHEEGRRALEQLELSVREAIVALGKGFLAHPANATLRDALQTGTLTTHDYYRQLLRLVYRLIFLFVAEDRSLLLDPAAESYTQERYTRFYSLGRLRGLAERQRGTRHSDMFHALRLVMQRLGSDGCAGLGLPVLGSFLFSPEALPDLDQCHLANQDLLNAIRALAFISDRHGRRLVDYRHLGSEELGSVYEVLLELSPQVNIPAQSFDLAAGSGSERKTTGSFYTPSRLIASLLDSALDPVVEASIHAIAGESRPPTPDPRSLISAEERLLKLKICDPACGSGHFLIAAAHRLAKRLAALRTGDDEPSPDATRTALRDVIGHCIYGVDINPMAVELCKVSLWMDALEPGKPLSFLDHHIQCGNSLFGATPALLSEGIPDDAFKPIEGDSKAVCSDYRKRNKTERSGQLSFFDSSGKPWERLGDLAASMQTLEAIDDGDMAGIARKQAQYAELVRSSGYLFGQLWADAWCAAFVWHKTTDALPPITEEVFRQLEQSPYRVDEATRTEIQRLAGLYRFFHWHIAFPEVFQVAATHSNEHAQTGWSGGFDVVLGNPPWERIKLQEKEWFATRHPDIANAPNAAARQRLIHALKQEDPYLYSAFLQDRRKAEGESHFVRSSGRFPLCGRGDVNTYSLFAETNRVLMSERGRVGCIVPSGIASDDTTKFFFQDLNDSRSLASLYDFENRAKLFPAVDSRMKFCLLTLTGSQHAVEQGAEFVFFAHTVADLEDDERRFTLSAQDIALINPNTRTCPIFRSRRDADLTKSVYRRVPVLLKEGEPEINPWGIRFMRMLDMSNDSNLFQTEPGEGKLPLYEAKLMHQFTHRWATYVHGESRDMTVQELADPDCCVTPRYWVAQEEVDARLHDWQHGWLLGFRDVTNTTNERTAIFSLLPRVGAGHKAPLVFLFSTESILFVLGFLANVNSFVFDYVARQKVGGTSLSYFILKQLPVLPPETYTPELLSYIVPRVLELVYMAWDMRPFAEDVWGEVFGETPEKGVPRRHRDTERRAGDSEIPEKGVPRSDGDMESRAGNTEREEGNGDGTGAYSLVASFSESSKLREALVAWCGGDTLPEPCAWDAERRFQIRCELDALYFHLYQIARDDVAYILETFPIVKRKDMQQYGEYRTKRVILEMYDRVKREA